MVTPSYVEEVRWGAAAIALGSSTCCRRNRLTGPSERRLGYSAWARSDDSGTVG
jgi:hypothetical protein